MIYFDFKIDEQELAEELETDIPNTEYGLFVATKFIMPVRFSIDGVELFEFENDVWSYMPIMSVASDGLASLLDARTYGSCKWMIIEGPGDVEFTMIDYNRVEVYFNDHKSGIRPIVNYNELLKAFFDYADKVRAFMWERVPQLNEHPHWGPWLRGERVW